MPPADVVGPAFAADRARYSIMGFSVCITAAFSFVALTSALSLVTGGVHPVHLAAGLVWALFVFNLDRWVVSAVDHGSGWRRTAREGALTVFRLTVAVMIGLSISVPLEMRIFQTEIDVTVRSMRGAEADATIAAIRQDVAYDPERTVEAAELATARTAAEQAQHVVEDANTALDLELSGGGGSQYPGVGGRSRQRQRDLDAADLARTAAASALVKAQTRYDQRAAALKAALTTAEDHVRAEAAGRRTGLIDRTKALATLAGDSAVAFVEWLVRGLILLVDVSPVLLKVLSAPTTYDRVRPRHAAGAERVGASRIEAETEVAQRRIQLDKALSLLRMQRSGDLENEQIERNFDIAVRRIRSRHKKTVRTQALADPRHPMVKPLPTPLVEDRRLRLVPDRRPNGRPGRHGRHAAHVPRDAG